MGVEPLTLREAVDTVETLLQLRGRTLSLGEFRMVERQVQAGVAMEDLVRMFGGEDPEPPEPKDHYYEAQGNAAVAIPGPEEKRG